MPDSPWRLAALVLLSCQFAAYSQINFTNPVIINEDSGLPSNYVTKITQGPDGFMWLGTNRGLCRFDGSVVKTFLYDPEDSLSLPGDEVYDILVDSKKRMWVGTSSGLGLYNPKKENFGSYKNYLFEEGKYLEGRVASIYEDRNGQLWMGHGASGLIQFDPNTNSFKTFPLQANPDRPDADVSRVGAILDIVEDPHQDSILWLATLSGLVRFNKISHTQKWYFHYMDSKDQQYLFNSMRALHPLANGKILVGNWLNLGVFDPQTESFRVIRMKDFGSKAPGVVYSFWARSGRELWVSFASGLGIFDMKTDQLIHFFPNREEENIWVGAEFIDEGGRIWSRSPQGASVFNPVFQQFKNYFYPASENWMSLTRAVVESEDGRYLYVCSLGGEGIYIFDREEKNWAVAKPSDRNQRKAPYNFHDMLRLENGRIMVLLGNRLMELDEKFKVLRPVKITFPHPAPAFRRMVEDQNGALWIGSRRQGLFRVNLNEEKVWQYQEELNQIPGSNRYQWQESVFVDSHNNVWIRTAWGYSVFESASERFWKFPEFDNNQPDTLMSNTEDFVEDDYGNIWISGGDYGLLKANAKDPGKGPVRQVWTKKDLQGHGLYLMKKDQKGGIWIDCDGELAYLNPKTEELRYFGKGYNPPESTGDMLAVLSTGEIVVGIKQGFSIFHPDDLYLNTEQPVPYLTSFKVFDQELKTTEGLLAPNLEEIDLSYTQNFFSFEFSAIGYNLPEAVNYSYMLEGVDPAWIMAGKRKYASYTNLDGGEYTFKLRVANSEGEWSEQIRALKIRISTPWWETVWFWFLFVVVMVALVLALFWWRIEQIKKREAIKTDFEKKLADVELSALRAQMNPHFIFNCLNSIDYYILKNDTDKASDYLNRFSRLIRLILQNSRSNYVNLRDELEALKLYIEMENLRFDEHFDYAVKVEKGLNLEEIEIPPMLLQPYVENAIWHGLVQKKGKGRLDLVITRENGHLHCVIKDDGIGRKAAQELRSKTATKGKSMGMQITSDRIGMINRLYHTNASVQVLDLQDSQGKATGTQVELNIPI